MTILVVTSADDDTATRVCRALARRSQKYARIDVGDFPSSLSITATGPGDGWSGTLCSADCDLSLSDIDAVYWRRPTTFRYPDEMSSQQRGFAVAEARQGFGGLIAGLPVPFVNHPSRIADAEIKPIQLQVAVNVGFTVPPTLITTDAVAARSFFRAHDRVVYKPFSAAFLHGQDGVELVYATIIEDPSTIDAKSLSLAPGQFQKFVDKDYDVRLTAVGSRRFAVAIRAGSDAGYVDWRADYFSLTYSVLAVPELVDRAITAYLAHFGLVFGCFDFAVDHDGRWWFLECGPNSQWGWLENETGVPIADAIAGHLSASQPSSTAARR